MFVVMALFALAEVVVIGRSLVACVVTFEVAAFVFSLIISSAAGGIPIATLLCDLLYEPSPECGNPKILGGWLEKVTR